MDRNDSSAAISSLASTYADDSASEPEPEPEPAEVEAEEEEVDNISGSDDEHHHHHDEPAGQSKPSPAEESAAKGPSMDMRKGRAATRLVSYGPDEHDEEHEESYISHEFVAVDDREEGSDTEMLDASMHSIDPSRSLPETVLGMNPEDIRVPPEPPFKCSKRLQEKIRNFYDKMVKQGLDLNASIQKRKDFRNPSIYEKLITFCKINEKGTNFPPEIYNPRIWGKESYYDELARAQKVEMDKREKERKERTKVEFVTGTKKSSDTSSSTTGEKRKTKWDTQPAPPVIPKPVVITTSSSNIPVVSLTTSSSGTKTTVISAVGTLSKKREIKHE